jgi:hypothetical protein
MRAISTRILIRTRVPSSPDLSWKWSGRWESNPSGSTNFPLYINILWQARATARDWRVKNEVPLDAHQFRTRLSSVPRSYIYINYRYYQNLITSKILI